MGKNSAKFYAYFLPATKSSGVVSSWAECEKVVKGISEARFRGFPSEKEAEDWIRGGAFYIPKEKPVLQAGIYFDAGTGRGHGVEVSVTDEQGKDLLHKAIPKTEINQWGKLLLGSNVTNNFGELLACKFALEVAKKIGSKNIFGDSALVLNHWSKGAVRKDLVSGETTELSYEVAALRREFEKSGGEMSLIDGDFNPADLGFH